MHINDMKKNPIGVASAITVDDGEGDPQIFSVWGTRCRRVEERIAHRWIEEHPLACAPVEGDGFAGRLRHRGVELNEPTLRDAGGGVPVDLECRAGIARTGKRCTRELTCARERGCTLTALAEPGERSITCARCRDERL